MNMNTPTERTKKKYLTSSEPFYYGRRLKAEVITITPVKDNSPRTYTGKLYTHGKKLIEEKSFNSYTKCYEYALNYLNTCKY